MTYQYSTDATTGEYLPVQIRYGGNTVASQNPDLAVRLSYEGRGDAQVQYMGGSRNDLRSRLTHIKTYIGTAADGSGGTLVRDHTVHYTESANSGRSLVDWMQACKGTECLPKTTFNWGDGGVPTPIVQDTFQIQDFTTTFKHDSLHQGNLDGSGMTSIFIGRMIGECFGDSTICDSPYYDGELRIRMPGGQTVDRMLAFASNSGPSDFNQIVVADIDGDGREDLILVDTIRAHWLYCQSTPASDGTADFAPCQAGGKVTLNGLPDPQGAPIMPTIVDLRNERKVHVITAFDASGNAQDCYFINGAIQCAAFHMTDLSPQTGWGQAGQPFVTITGIELSKAGMSDFYSVWQGSNYITGATVCSTRLGGTVCQAVPQAASQTYSLSPVTDSLAVGDINGDGLTDFIYLVTVHPVRQFRESRPMW